MIILIIVLSLSTYLIVGISKAINWSRSYDPLYTSAPNNLATFTFNTFLWPTTSKTIPIFIESAILKTSFESGANSPYGVGIVPKKMIQDSRCPKNVDCYWQGTVIVEAEITSGRADVNEIHNFELHKTLISSGAEITLIDVKPERLNVDSIALDAYEFTFEIKNPQLKYDSEKETVIKAAKEAIKNEHPEWTKSFNLIPVLADMSTYWEISFHFPDDTIMGGTPVVELEKDTLKVIKMYHTQYTQ